MSERVNHEGETKIANNGLKMTIIKYRKYKDIDIRFEGGAIVRHKRYDNFLAGRIRHPKISSHRNRIIDRTGETLSASAEYNFKKWNTLGTRAVSPQPWSVAELKTYEDNVEYIRNFVINRWNWINSRLGE